MKKVIAFLFLVFATSLIFAQVTIDDIPLEKEFSHVFFSTNGVNKIKLNAKSWIAKSFGDYKAVLQYEDNENNRIIIKGETPITVEYSSGKNGSISSTSSQQFLFTMTFDFKEDRYRIRFEDIKIMGGLSFGSSVPVPDMEVNWDRHFTLDTSSIEKEIIKLKRERNVLQDQLLGKLSKKEIESISSRIAKLDERIADSEDYVTNRAVKRWENNILEFKTTFCNLFNSAAKSIEEDDDF